MNSTLEPVPLMKICDPLADALCDEREMFEALLPFDGADVLELGCGRAEKTRVIAGAGRINSLTACEVDRIQHARNLLLTDLPKVTFALGGAEEIPAPDRKFDIVMMFKSLHHVPVDKMPQAFAEIRRVLKPGGLLYLSEPVFAGAYNEIMRLFHDEESVRKAAFESAKEAVRSGMFELVAEKFFNAEVRFNSFAQYEERVIRVTHSDHRLSSELYATVQQKFMAHLGPQGAVFLQPMRVDLLRRPAARR